MSILKTDIIIVGAGPVGLFTVFECGMQGMKCHVIDALSEPGGQPANLYPEKYIYDIPAYPKILASELVEKLKEQASVYSPTYHFNQQVHSYENIEGGLRIKTTNGTQIECKALILAIGGGAFGPNRPPIEGIENYENKSVHYFITKRSIFDNQPIVIAGGGDSAVDWAIMLADTAKKVYMVHRRDNFRAVQSSIDKMYDLVNKGKIEMVIPYQLSKINGDGTNINTIGVENLSGDTKTLEATHLLAFFGLARDLGNLTSWGFHIDKSTVSIAVDPTTCETNIPRIFSVGDGANYPRKLKLILTGFAESANAVHKAWEYVFPDKVFHFTHSTSK